MTKILSMLGASLLWVTGIIHINLVLFLGLLILVSVHTQALHEYTVDMKEEDT